MNPNPYKEGTQKNKIFEVLSDLSWHCSECELPGSQPAKALQGLRQDGFELEKNGSNWEKRMHCNNCNRVTPHRRLVSVDRTHEPISRITISSKLRERIIKLFENRDEILGYSPTGRAIEIDHRFPEVRWNGSEPELDISASDEELKNRYMLLVREHNLLKSRNCETCKRTGIRGSFPGIYYWYSGDKHWPSDIPDNDEAGCAGCFWYKPSEWKEKLNEIVNKTDEKSS